MWNYELIPCPSDGSCFFTSIAIALNECVDTWYDIEIIREKMEKYWNDYNKITGETPQSLTQHFIRFMCSKNIDEDSLMIHNVEAEFMKDKGDKSARIFESVEDFQEHIFDTNCWTDHSIFLAFHKSLGYRLSLIVFDSDVTGVTHFDREWTENKDMYICLRRDGNHYNTIRISKDDTKYELCVSRNTISAMLSDINDDLGEKDKISVII